MRVSHILTTDKVTYASSNNIPIYRMQNVDYIA